MNLNATTRDEVLNSIDHPVLRQIKEFDLNAKCNPTSFRNLVFDYFVQDNPDCKLGDKASRIYEEYDELESYKEQDRVFRFLFLHHLKLLTCEEYKVDWLTFWEKSLNGKTLG